VVRDEIIRKLKSLFRLARKAGSEGESLAAMAAAKRLMAEYNISEEDAVDRETEEAIQQLDAGAFKNALWFGNLATAAGLITGTRPLRSSYNVIRQKSRLVFFGEPGDVHIAALLLKELIRCASKHSTIFPMGIPRNSFCMGFSTKVLLRAQEKNDLPAAVGEKFALALSNKQSRIEEYLKSKEVGNHVMPRKKEMIDPYAYAVGINIGQAVDLGIEKRLTGT